MWKNLPYKGCVYFSLLLNVFSLAVILALKGILPPVIPLFYGLPSGVEQLAPTLELIIAPVIGLFMVIINASICSSINDMFLKKTLVISTLFISLLMTITVAKIVFLVGFF